MENFFRFFRPSPVDIRAQLHDLYHCTCHECMGLPSLSAEEDEVALPEVWETLLKDIYEGAVGAGDIDDATAIAMAEENMKGVIEGFGKGFDNIDYDTPDFILLEHLEKDVYKFS